MTLLRRFSVIFVVLCAFFSAHSSPAQISAYGSVMYDRFGFDGANYSGVSYKPANGGVIGGVFFTIPDASRFKGGIDARATYGVGSNGGSAYTAAFRFSFVPHHNPLRPYAQIGGGVVSSDGPQIVCYGALCGVGTARITNPALHLAFGLDIRATSHLDVRAFDYGADADGSNGPTRAAVGFLDAGLVYHFR